MRSRSRSRERRAYRRRSRSRSSNRQRKSTKDRYYNKRDRSRSRSRSQSEVEKLLKKEREKAKQDRHKPVNDSLSFIADGSTPSTSSLNALLTLDPSGNKELVKIIKERVDHEVKSRHEEFEAEIQRRLTATRQEMEVSIRCQVEMQLRDEMIACQKRESDAKQKCEALERELRSKMEMLEESRRKVEEERLEMLEMKRKLDEEKNNLRKEREKVNQNEQGVILGKGNARPKLRFSFGNSK